MFITTVNHRQEQPRVPHNIPSTTRKINITICSPLQKGKRSRSVADGKRAQWNLHEAQAHAEAVAWHFPCTAPGATAVVFGRDFKGQNATQPELTKCCVAGKWHQTFAGDAAWHHCSLQYDSPGSVTWSSSLPVRWLLKSHPHPACNSLTSAHLVLQGTLNRINPCCFLTHTILWLISDLLTFSFSLKVYSIFMTWPADCKIHI